MKITKKYLQNLIKEEVASVLSEKEYTPPDKYKKRIDSIEYIQHTDPNLERHKSMSEEDLMQLSPERLLNLFVVIKLREEGYTDHLQGDFVARGVITRGPHRYKMSEYELLKAQIKKDGDKTPIVKAVFNLLKNLPNESEEDLAIKRQIGRETSQASDAIRKKR